jgi:hypothetical protein
MLKAKSRNEKCRKKEISLLTVSMFVHIIFLVFFFHVRLKSFHRLANTFSPIELNEQKF